MYAYKYDAAGQRRVKVTPTQYTLYVNQFYTVRNGEIATKHIFAGSSRVVSKLHNVDAMGRKDTFLYYYHPDHLGSTNYVTDKNGDLYEHIEYFPSGETWVKEDKRSETDPKRVAYMFSSREFDEETGLYYVGARYYDPRTSVWQSADPILGAYVGSAGMLDSSDER